MSKTLVLADTGFSKTTSLMETPQYGIVGLNPKETFIVSPSGELPVKHWKKIYPMAANDAPPATGNFLHTTDAGLIAKDIRYIVDNRPEITTIVIDDQQYLMGDYYCDNALKGDQYVVFKKIGNFMSDLYKAIDEAHRAGKHIIVLSHFEESGITNDGLIRYTPKTAGKMVQNHLTLEGKYQVVLYGKFLIKDGGKTIERVFVTNADGDYNQAKSPPGLFDSVYIPNDMGFVINKIKEYEGE